MFRVGRIQHWRLSEDQAASCKVPIYSRPGKVRAAKTWEAFNEQKPWKSSVRLDQGRFHLPR